MAEIEETSEKIVINLDEKDRKLLNLLNRNSRATLKELAREVGLSIDGVKYRMDKMRKAKVIERFTILVDFKYLDFSMAVHVYVKLQNLTEEKKRKFLAYLKGHDRVIVLSTMIGDYDAYFVLLAKSVTDFENTEVEIRTKFSDLISEWKELMSSKVYKLEEYQF